ncbi:MAG TPA: hypothetical protein VFN45_17865 [Myxococcaceae bacterium]|nr:hypothetical protein [Myxococcaceae bacterium]
MAEDPDTAWRSLIREGMTVLGMDGDALGRVFEIGDHALALERGAFFPHEWTASFTEIDRVDEQGVWLRHGRASLERVSDAFCGPTEAYRESAEASPIHQWSGFRPTAVTHEEGSPPPASSAEQAADEPLIPGQNSPSER